MSRIRIEITVLDNASIFSGVPGAESLYRYDLPAAGLAEGWATKSMIQQVKDLAGHDWPNIDVAVKGNEEATEPLIHSLLAQGAVAFPADYSPPRHRVRRRNRRPLLTIGCVAVVAACTAIGMAVYVREERGPQVLPASAETSEVLTSAAASTDGRIIYKERKISFPTSSTAAPSTRAESYSGTLAATNSTVTLNGFVLPAQVNWEVVGDGVVGSPANDPEQRIMVLRDLVYEDALMQQLIAEDKNLRAVSPQHGRSSTIDYIEEPGDGSQVYWASWRENPTRISVGCHTKNAPNATQQQRCKDLIEQTNTLKKVAGQG